ncbi:Ger(x)C family spore germination protein [Bacillus benzoevorans]|uniref:Spore germination protein KC n=1 Tax=Bacillus benzoevorans TaxID=1456 RepID=A0A7X0LWV1_9BACI|nr:Ger(x)C family spore germination protein [Bacillus benzoevorans]MBB6447118.1 spore germination protein KC [Bacillus benzoevorans]
MIRKPLFLMVLLLSIVCLSGCWDRKELQDIDIVSAIGIDAGGDDAENRYLVTVQVINEGLVAGGSQKGGMTNTSPVTIFSAKGSTVAEALRKIAPKLPQELFFPHVQLMVLGQELVQEKGIKDLFDWIERDSQFRTLFPILIVKDHTARDVLKIMTSLEPIPSAKIVGGLESTQKMWGEFASTRADKVIQQIGGEVTHIAGVQITGDSEKGNKLTNVQQIAPDAELEIKGLAIIKEGKLVKWLDGDAARGVTWINNELKKTVLNLDCKGKDLGIAIDVLRSKSNITAEIKKGKPIIHIAIRAEGHISEVHCPIALDKSETFYQLEEQMEQEIKEEVLLALKAARAEKSDIFHFDETLNRKDPKLWKEIKGKWNDEIFPETEIDVKVKGFIRRSGLRTKPYIK